MSAVLDCSHNEWLGVVQHSTQYFDFFVFPQHATVCRIVSLDHPIMRRFSATRASLYEPNEGVYYVCRSRYEGAMKRRVNPFAPDAFTQYEAFAMATAVTFVRTRFREHYAVPLRTPWMHGTDISDRVRAELWHDSRVRFRARLLKRVRRVRMEAEKMLDSDVIFAIAFDAVACQGKKDDSRFFFDLITQ